jgi:gliding motility-associated-like protein
MKKHIFLILFCVNFTFSLKAQITLTHNIGNTPIKTDWVSCEDDEYWARTFTLSEFGISSTDQFIIRSGQVAISNAYDGAIIIFNVYSIDENFPSSEPKRIGYGNFVKAPLIGDTPEIVQIDFFTPIVIPSDAKGILIEVTQGSDVYNSDYKKFLIAGTERDNDTSWFQGCRELYTYTSAENLSTPVPNANFFINVTGEKLSTVNSDTNVVLSHNVGDNVIKTNMFSCSSSYQYWAKKFELKDFNINENEELIIYEGQVGLSGVEWGSSVQFNIYKIDNDFPTSFSEIDLIGSSQILEVPYFSYGGNAFNAKIALVEFDTPIVVPADVKMILVEVHSNGQSFIAGTQNENDFSWYRGCNGSPSGDYRTTDNLANAGIPYWTEGLSYYITVNGEAKTIFPFEITDDNNCINFSNDFSLTNQTEIDTVTWNFDDPTTGLNNTSTDINTIHQFSNPGIYTITANVLHIDGTRYTIPKEIEIFDAPNVNPIVELKQCDNSDINGFSFFNLNEVKEEIITNSNDYTITFYEEKIDAENHGTAITNVTNYKNKIVSIDKIWARVENNDGCYSVSEVNLFVSTTQIPATVLNSFYQCDDGTNTTDGIATFDFSAVTSDIIDVFPTGQQLIINYYRNENDALSEENAITDITNYQNIGYPNQQNIYIRVDSKFDNDCLGLGAHISLNVEKVPVANSVTINPECDNDRDGFYSFDTSTIQATIIGSQTNVAVNYFDENGTQLSSPLPNPFITESQTITARIVNTLSNDLDGQCFDETTLNFIVNSVPIANIITPQEVCDTDLDGVFGFDTSAIESQVLNGQTGLIVTYFNENNTELHSPLPNPFYTTSQTIRVRLENPVYDICYEETAINFIVRQKPTFDLIKEAIICITSNPQLEITIENPNDINSYVWKNENNVTISNQSKATVVKGGIYKVIATSKYGCNSEEQKILVRESSVATITINDIEVQDDSENNNIQISTSNLGLGNYKFRLLDENESIVFDYQEQPYFENLKGGVYTIEVNDENGCGKTPFEVSLLEFPHFFTPNNDGKNDTWQIKGISKNFYKSGNISIFNRYGKLISTFTIDDFGWDGTYNGNVLSTNDYWFYTELIDQKDISRSRRGNFSLIRK